MIDTNLTGMKNKNLSDTTYVQLNQNRSNAATAYTDMRSKTAAIGNYEFSCSTSDPGCTTPSGPARQLFVFGAERYADGRRFRIPRRNPERCAQYQPVCAEVGGATGTLVSNVTDLANQMAAIKTANTAIVTDAGDIYSNLSTAATRQAALSTSWRDTASSGNVDTTRVANVASRISSNSPLIGEFNDNHRRYQGQHHQDERGPRRDGSGRCGGSGRYRQRRLGHDRARIAEADHHPGYRCQAGNVDVKGDIPSGTGTLKAPGDAKIWIITMPTSMDIGNLTVDSDGGNVRLNGFQINNTTRCASLQPPIPVRCRRSSRETVLPACRRSASSATTIRPSIRSRLPRRHGGYRLPPGHHARLRRKPWRSAEAHLQSERQPVRDQCGRRHLCRWFDHRRQRVDPLPATAISSSAT